MEARQVTLVDFEPYFQSNARNWQRGERDSLRIMVGMCPQRPPRSPGALTASVRLAPDSKPRVTLRSRLPDRTVSSEIAVKSLSKAQTAIEAGAPTTSRTCCKATSSLVISRGRTFRAAEDGENPVTRPVITHGCSGEMKSEKRVAYALSFHSSSPEATYGGLEWV
jgi:hypothetical protein